MRKVLLLTFIGMLVLGGVATAAIPSSDGIIHGCYLTSGNPNVRGALRVIDVESGEQCSSGEAPISWRANLDTQRIEVYGGVIPPGGAFLVQAPCPSGTEATGGGFTVDRDVFVEASTPIGGSPSNLPGWQVKGYNPTLLDKNVWATAICGR